MINKYRLDKIFDLVETEFINANEKFNIGFNSFHEGYSIIHEELDELWDNVKLKNPNPEKLKKEAKQVAAMAIRFLYDLIEV